MRYPGTATLTREMQERILATFRQTLAAAAAGNRKEALLGCDFILRLDSLFSPARELHDRLETGDGPVETADLAAAVGEPPPQPPSSGAADAESAAAAGAAAVQPPDIDELDDLDLDAPLEPPAAPAPPPTAPPASEPPAAQTASPAPPPAVDQLEDLDLGPAEPLETAAPPAPPAPEPEAPVLGALDDLEDLDLSAEPEPPAEAPPVDSEPPAPQPEAAAAEPEPPAPEAEAPEAAPEPPAAEPEATAAEAPPPAEPEPQPAPAAAAEAQEIPLGAEPAAQIDSESQQRIDELMGEGQEAFDRGEYQGAIDAWSRIFLIDIDHAEANRRIEEARKLKAEGDRKIEEKFHEGLAALEGGDTEAAAATFREVLEMQPSHLTARDYLDKLEAGEVPVAMPAEPAAAAAPEEAADELAQEITAEAEGEAKPKPDRGTKAVGPRMVTVKRSPFKSKPFLISAALGVVAVLGGGWYLLSNWTSLFPNSAPEAAVAEPRPDPIARAKELHAEGKTPIAIAQLRRLRADSPQHAEAQALIAQWELEQAPADQGPAGPSPEELAEREALIAEARTAAADREFLRTSELLSEAAAIAPLSGAEVQLLAQADEQLQELQNFITIFREGEWDYALRDLWLLHESDPGNRDVTRLLVDSYYNLGVRALQRSDPKAAAENFAEAIELSPGDTELLRLAEFARTYQTRQPDLLYRIFVKYVPFR